MSLNVRSGEGQIPTFVDATTASVPVGAIGANVETNVPQDIAVQNVPGVSVSTFNGSSQGSTVVQVQNTPNVPLTNLIADPNFSIKVFSTVSSVPIDGTGFIHAVDAVNQPGGAWADPYEPGAIHYTLGGSALNNGVLVGETGKIGGSLSGVAGTGPLPLNWPQLVSDFGSGNYGANDRIYIDGTVTPSGSDSPLEIRSGMSVLAPGQMLNVSGLPDARDTSIIDLSNISVGQLFSGLGFIHSSGSNIRLSVLHVRHRNFCFSTGVKGATQNIPSHGCIWENIRFTSVGNIATDNAGFFKFDDSNGNIRDAVIRGCYSPDNVGGNSNVASTYIINDVRVTYEYNHFEHLGVGTVFEQKWGSPNIYTLGDIRHYRNVYKSHGTNRGIFYGCMARIQVLENLLISNKASNGDFIAGKSADSTKGDLSDGYNNEFGHNMIVSENTAQRFGIGVTSGPHIGTGGSSQDNIYQGNIWVNTVHRVNHDQNQQNHQSVSESNLYPATSALGRQNGTDYSTLASWQAQTALFDGASHDQLSIEADAIFIAGTQDIATPSSYNISNGGGLSTFDGSNCGPKAIGITF